MAAVSGGVLAGGDADEPHELGGMVEAGEVADLADEGDGVDEGDATEAHEGLDEGEARPGADLGLDGVGEAVDAGGGIGDGADEFLKGDALGWEVEDLSAEVVEVLVGPGALAGVAAAVAEEEGLEAPTTAAEVVDGRLAGTNEVADGLVGGVRDADEGEFAGTEEAGEGEGVAPGLDAVGGALGDKGRADDLAVDVLGSEVPTEGEAGGAGLIDVARGGAPPAERRLWRRSRAWVWAGMVP